MLQNLMERFFGRSLLKKYEKEMWNVEVSSLRMRLNIFSPKKTRLVGEPKLNLEGFLLLAEIVEVKSLIYRPKLACVQNSLNDIL
jgi:hypothetical protein